jgi:hypothetical protein
VTENEIYEARQYRAYQHRRQQQKKRLQQILYLLVAVGCVVMLVLSALPEQEEPDASMNVPSPTEPSIRETDPIPTFTAPVEVTEPEPTEVYEPCPNLPWPQDMPAAEALAYFTRTYGLSENDYPDQILHAITRDEENLDFLLRLPVEVRHTHKIDLTQYDISQGVPLFIQWDAQWGYLQYAGNYAGLSGCGPVCLSMVAYYLTGDPEMTPAYMMEMSEKNGYCGNRQGSFWSLFAEGGEKVGLKVEELPLVENIIINHLRQGHPIILSMGPGVFTAGGHYVVLAGYEDGKYIINDPNSYERSEKRWTYREFANQVTNLWAFSV